MITCDKQFLFDRARERGHRVSEVMPCVVSRDGDQWTIDENHPAYPATHKPAPIAPGLGDMVASGLDALGITKARVQAMASAVGIKDCGCAKRQQAMNEWAAKRLGIGDTFSESKMN